MTLTYMYLCSHRKTIGRETKVLKMRKHESLCTQNFGTRNTRTFRIT